MKKHIFWLALVFALVGCTSAPPVPGTRAAATTIGPMSVPSQSLPTTTHTPTPLPGHLFVVSTPSPATVWLNGQQIGLTPLSSPVNPGKHRLSVFVNNHERWNQAIEVIPSKTLTVTAQLRYTPIVTVADSITQGYVLALEWSQDARLLTYAVGDPWFDEPHEWSWWQFDTASGQKQSISAPPGQVSQVVRERLGIRPASKDNCETFVSVSPRGKRIVYTSLHDIHTASYDDLTVNVGYGLWTANIDGSNKRRLGEIFSGCNRASWSSKEDRFIVATYPEAGDPVFFLVSVDGSLFKELYDATGLSICPGYPPIFSPDGTRFAFNALSGLGDSCGVMVADANSSNAIQVHSQASLIQWSSDSQHLYALAPPLLYKFLIQGATFTSTILADNIPNTPSNMLHFVMLVSPDETTVAFQGIGAKTRDFGIIRFASK